MQVRKVNSKNFGKFEYAVVENVFRTATGMCSGLEERQESVKLASKIAISNVDIALLHIASDEFTLRGRLGVV